MPLWDNKNYFVSKMRKTPYHIVSTDSPIIPILIGDEKLSSKFTDVLRESGIHVDSVKFPSVPHGRVRLRVILNAKHTKEQIDHLVDDLLRNKDLMNF